MVRAAPGPLLRKIAPAVLLIVQALSVASSVVGLPFKMPTENLQELKDMANNMDEFLRCMPCFDGEEEELEVISVSDFLDTTKEQADSIVDSEELNGNGNAERRFGQAYEALGAMLKQKPDDVPHWKEFLVLCSCMEGDRSGRAIWLCHAHADKLPREWVQEDGDAGSGKVQEVFSHQPVPFQ